MFLNCVLQSEFDALNDELESKRKQVDDLEASQAEMEETGQSQVTELENALAGKEEALGKAESELASVTLDR